MTMETPTDRVRRLVSGVNAELLVCGHTHMQYDRRVDGLRIVNAGSVGMPYGEHGAYWAMLGPGVSLRHKHYDRESAAGRMFAKGSPAAEQFARENVLAVPTIEEVMAFDRAAEARQASSAC